MVAPRAGYLQLGGADVAAQYELRWRLGRSVRKGGSRSIQVSSDKLGAMIGSGAGELSDEFSACHLNWRQECRPLLLPEAAREGQMPQQVAHRWIADGWLGFGACHRSDPQISFRFGPGRL